MNPTDATVNYGDSYEATCTSGYTLDGVSMMTCQEGGTFDQTPTCEGKMLYNVNVPLMNVKLSTQH